MSNKIQCHNAAVAGNYLYYSWKQIHLYCIVSNSCCSGVTTSDGTNWVTYVRTYVP